jgi:hypothetical protein
MKRRGQFVLLTVALATLSMARPHPGAALERVATPQAALDQTPLTADQIHDLILRTIANQHRDDAALDSFERIEHQTSHSGRTDKLITQDRTYRVVPTGSGTLKLLIKQNGAPVAPGFYQRQLRDWENILEVAVHRDDPREIAVVAKEQKRRKESARFVDAVRSVYQFTWLGRETRDGRVVEKIQLDPNPNYPPHGDSTDWLTHARAIVCIDPQAAQVVAVDATIIRDISIGAGVFGKIYRGGTFHMEQAPAAPDIWEPTLYQYDISGRKFLFSFAMHESTTSTHYEFFSGPEKALEVAKDNLAHCCNLIGDP